MPRGLRATTFSMLQGKLHRDDVDKRMIRALADMPSDLALEAVDRFGTSSLDTVRSKVGFMVSALHPWRPDWLK